MENAYVYAEGGMHDKPHGRKVSIFSLRSFKWGVLDHAFCFLYFPKINRCAFFLLGYNPACRSLENSELKKLNNQHFGFFTSEGSVEDVRRRVTISELIRAAGNLFLTSRESQEESRASGPIAGPISGSGRSRLLAQI